MPENIYPPPKKKKNVPCILDVSALKSLKYASKRVVFNKNWIERTSSLRNFLPRFCIPPPLPPKKYQYHMHHCDQYVDLRTEANYRGFTVFHLPVFLFYFLLNVNVAAEWLTFQEGKGHALLEKCTPFTERHEKYHACEQESAVMCGNNVSLLCQLHVPWHSSLDYLAHIASNSPLVCARAVGFTQATELQEKKQKHLVM